MSWTHTSASQLKTFRLCPRKWYRESILKERSPPTKATERGQKIHSELENYLIHGHHPEDTAARAMLSLLPSGGTVPPEQVEVEFLYMPQGWPIPIKGFVDLCLPPYEIIDHKSTSNFKYALEEHKIKDDPQALLYVAAALDGELGHDYQELSLIHI